MIRPGISTVSGPTSNGWGSTLTVLPDGPCRYCGRPSYLSDDEGPLHPCCKKWIGEWGYKTCVACSTSDAAHRERERRGPRRTTPAPLPRIAPKPRIANRESSPVVRNTDPETAHVAAAAIEPKRDTRKALVLELLREAGGNWVNGSVLCTEDVGGSEGLRRLRELHDDGWDIRKRPNPRSQTAWQYRLPVEAG